MFVAADAGVKLIKTKRLAIKLKIALSAIAFLYERFGLGLTFEFIGYLFLGGLALSLSLGKPWRIR
jgi:hypothetical protein